jgi:7-cyano-7-deazaguanine synthase
MGELLRRGRTVQPIFIRSRLCWEEAELEALQRYLDHQQAAGLRKLIVLDVPMTDLYGQHWSVTGQGTPESTSAEEDVYLPGRNALLVLTAAVWCQRHQISELALATLATSPFADASLHFIDRMQAVLDCYGNGSAPVQIALPFGKMTKRQVMQIGSASPLALTFSCIRPTNGHHCGQCNKCEERRRAFRESGLHDPTQYARP